MYSSRKYSVKRHVYNVHGSGLFFGTLTMLQVDKLVIRSRVVFPLIKNAEPERVLTKLKTDAFQEGYWSEAGRYAYRQGHSRIDLYRYR